MKYISRIDPSLVFLTAAALISAQQANPTNGALFDIMEVP